MNNFKEKLANLTNPKREAGSLASVLKGANIFIGVSAPNTVTKDMVRSMAKKPIVFALANPVPEITPMEAKEAGALIVATGRSDYNNQVNNSLAFPGIFRGAIDTKAMQITIEMKIAASRAIAAMVTEDELTPNYIIPDTLNSRVPVAVAMAVAREAIRSKKARNIDQTEELIEDNVLGWLLEQKQRNWSDISRRNMIFSKNELKPKF